MNSPWLAALAPLRVGLVLCLLAILFGQGVGIAFGAAEEAMKHGLEADAKAALETRYGGDAAKAKAVVDKAWVYYKRAHLHAGAIGTTSLALILLLAALPGALLARRAAAIALGGGALGYGVFWLLAGMRAPSLGGTGAAKESLAWLAIPTSGALVAGTAVTLGLLTLALWRKREA